MNPSTRLKITGLSMLLPRKEPSPLVPNTGATRKSPKPSTSAKMRVPAISFLESSSSPSAMFVDMVSAFIPSHRVSPRERAPLIMGRRNSLLRRVTERNRSARRSISPEGVRTAIPQKLGERIKTPSIMACPPTLMCSALLPVLASLAAILEALHPTAGVHYALLACIERVALRAEVHRDRVPRRRACLELVAAHAAHQRLRILWMYSSLHPVPPSFTWPLSIVYYVCKGGEGRVR